MPSYRPMQLSRLFGLVARARAAWRDSVRFCDADDAESAWLRAQHLAAVLRLTPVMKIGRAHV